MIEGLEEVDKIEEHLAIEAIEVETQPMQKEVILNKSHTGLALQAIQREKVVVTPVELGVDITEKLMAMIKVTVLGEEEADIKGKAIEVIMIAKVIAKVGDVEVVLKAVEKVGIEILILMVEELWLLMTSPMKQIHRRESTDKLPRMEQ